MRNSWNISLRWRLLGGFLLAALFTILSGVSGIVSLQRIRHNMSVTASQVSDNVHEQSDQTNVVINLRDILDKIHSATTTEELDLVEQRISSGKDVLMTMRLKELLEAKRQQKTSAELMAQYDQTLNESLNEINTQLSEIVDNITFEVLLGISDVIETSLSNASLNDPNDTQAADAISQYVDNALTKIKSALSARASILELHLAMTRTSGATDLDIPKEYANLAERLFTFINAQLDPLDQETGIDEVEKYLEQLYACSPKFTQAKTADIQSAQSLAQISSEIFDEARTRSLQVLTSSSELEKNVNQQFVGSSRFTQKSMAVLVVISLVAFSLSLTSGIHMARSIARSINQVVQRVKDVADGNLTQSLKANGTDEIGMLATHFNGMVGNLKEILSRIQGVAVQITSTGQEIRSISEAQASGATEQSSAVSETSSAAAELSKTSEQIGENIKTISQMANHVLTGMEKIKEATDQTNQILTSLNDKSKQIGNITELIDDVADQTNLLAVNASIEAARAGEQGRGFTVVADQISKLADSTAKSTKDITSLVEMIQHEMSNAIIAMEQSLVGVEEEIQLAKDSAAKSREIAMSANQQISGSRQIADAMASIDRTMKDIVVGAQRSASSASQLTGLADELRDSMTCFKVNENV